jgi:hypothetical protein
MLHRTDLFNPELLILDNVRESTTLDLFERSPEKKIGSAFCAILARSITQR